MKGVLVLRMLLVLVAVLAFSACTVTQKPQTIEAPTSDAPPIQEPTGEPAEPTLDRGAAEPTEEHEPNEGEAKEPVPVLEPAEFVLSDLEIDPNDVTIGDTSQISVNVVNVGEETGSYEVTLNVNGQTIDTTTVSLRGGEAQTVYFTYRTETGTESREYEIGVGDMSDTLTAMDPLSIYEGYVFGFVDGSDPLEPLWSEKIGAFIPRHDDTREQLTLDETFTVAAGEEVVFENQIVWVRPNRRQDIEVYGTLLVKDSILFWDQTEHQQTRLRIKDGGQLRIEDSYVFQSNSFWLNWEYESGSTIYLDGFVGQPWTSIHGSVDYTAINYSTVSISFQESTNDSVVEISDAHHVWVELIPSDGRYDITFPEKRQWVDWQLPSMWPNTTVAITHSYLYERDISLTNNTHVTVSDTPSGFGLGWGISKISPGFVDCELRGLGNPEDDEGVFYEYMVWDLPCNNSSLTVKNSLLQRVWPVTWGQVHLKIYDSNLVDPRNFGGPATMEIYDSTIDFIAAYQGGRVYIENSMIRYDIEVKDPGSTIYSYGVSRRDEDIDNRTIEVNGGVYTELESPGPPW
jgi:hypothetical protein